MSVIELFSGQMRRIFDLRPKRAASLTAAQINAAIVRAHALGGGKVILPPGEIVVGETIFLKNGVELIGQGRIATTIKQEDGADLASIIETDNFADLTGTNSWFVIAENVRYGFGISDLEVNGNKANNTGTIGVRVYGKGFRIFDFTVRDCPGIGLWCEAGSKTGQNNYRDMPEAYVHMVRCRNNGGVGFEMRGPHNALIGAVWSAYNGDYGIRLVSDDSVSYDGNIDDAQLLHTYANAGDKGIYINTKVSIGRCITDGDNITFDSGATSTSVRSLKCLNGGGARDGVEILDSRIKISHCLITAALANGADKRTLVKIADRDCSIGILEIAGNKRSNDGLVITGDRCHIGSASFIEIQGATGRAFVLDATNCILSTGHIQSCTTGLEYNRGARNSLNFTIFTGEDQVAVAGDPPSDTDDFNVEAHGEIVGGTRRIMRSELISLTTTDQQEIVVPHQIIYDMDTERVQLTLIKSTNANDFQVQYMRVSGFDATNITIEFKLATASSTVDAQARIGIWVKA